MTGFHCSACGEFHDSLPMSYGTAAPLMWSQIPEDKRQSRCELSEDLCVIDDTHRFIRGCLELPVLDSNQPFVWEVWCSLSDSSFRDCIERWDQEGRKNAPPYFGWLSTALPLYPSTVNLKTHVHTRALGLRPRVELEPTDHPPAIEQREGIRWEQVKAIAEALLHPE
ncbi:DUF2199 domain-containing protein [Rhodopirellula sp. MGV]|uniref:DUF2199 domain-containing protein n=1 Tax=Rhodopirellula sp. MGV TaxID=2023130 RepID=UPI000B972E3B|nr:DUF2199 domain-containing protein [Rhodopirellula sp. MGV]OYP38263.1 hypothetical protein CGZ80_03340 [Rhodopirellula sp. MGV]PNY38601.1 DUF2199 domain-containing protein [Rhodopirellula baltica]